jgi:hypothetical protein
MLRRLQPKLVGTAVAVSALVAGTVVASPPAVAGSTRTITVHIRGEAITFSSGDTVAPGFAKFRVVVGQGEHTLQLLRLEAGYTVRQAKRDIGKAFGGDTDAIRRVDRRIMWLGGAVATGQRDGRFAETLYSGDYLVLDQDHNGLSRLHVSGASTGTGAVAATSTVTAATSNRDNVFHVPGATMPHAGWTLFRNRAAEPHFMILQPVARDTTRKDVRRYFASNSQDDPPWLRDAFTSTGVISPDTQQYFHYRLPRGRYLMICFWPSIETGAPHGVMGMYRLVDLR